MKRFASGGVIDKNDPDEALERSVGHGEHAVQRKGRTKGRFYAGGGAVKKFADGGRTWTDKLLGRNPPVILESDKKAEPAPTPPPTKSAPKETGGGKTTEDRMKAAGAKAGGAVKKYARGGGVELRGKTRGRCC